MSTLEDKKRFITWVSQNIRFEEREAYWLLGYLLSNDHVMRKVRIVEHVETTPRGIRFAEAGESGYSAYEMFKHTQSFEYAEQIFHEMRFNNQFDLYLEFIFEDSWKNQLYLAVLEDNPYYSWNTDNLAPLNESTESYLDQLEKNFEMKEIKEKIDQALEEGDVATFNELSEYLAIKEAKI